MDELLRLLGLADGISDMSDDDLAQYQSDLRDAAEEVIGAGEVDDETIAQLERAAEVVAAVDAEVERREQEDAERAERVSSIAERLRGERAEGDEGTGEGDGDGEGDEGGDGGEGGDAEADRVAASARSARVSRLRPRRPDLMEAQRRRMRRNSSDAPVSLVAAANLGSIEAGTTLDEHTLAEAMIEAYRLSEGYKGVRAKVPVARVGYGDVGELYGEERTLRRSSPEDNTAKVHAVTSPAALVAAGGICAPTPVRYDLPAVGVDDRPGRDDMTTRFGADRGGIRTLPPPELTEFSGAVAAWTEENDRTPTDPTTKPCLTMTCPDDDETLVDAITRCIRIGNFRARFFPEQVQTWVDQAAVWHARFAERRMLTAIGAGSTQVSSGTLLGAAIDILTTLDRAVASLRSFRRIPRTQRVRLGLPTWTLDLMRTDIARQIGQGSLDDKLAAADATIEAWIEARNVNVTWLLDGETGQEFGAQGDGPLNGWPSTVIGYMYPEGSWLFLDGGTLDLGIIRDSTLVGVNDYLLFAETFENVHFHGLDSWRISFDVCPDGSTAGTVDINPCSTGS